MNIPKAIEILYDWGVISKPQVDQDLLNAVKLGIEALKRHQSRQNKDFSQDWIPLPGETEN